MELGAIDAVLRKYLLGDASAQEQEQIDNWLMSDKQAYDLMEAAEDDLIDDALAQRLDGRDLRLFNENFLATPQRQRKFQLSRSFQRAVNVAQPKNEPKASFTLWDLFRYRPGLAFVASALMVVLLVGGAWSLVRLAELQQQLHSATDQLAGLNRDREDLQRQLEESQAQTRAALQQQAQPPETPGRGQAPSTLALMAMTLVPGITRSSSDIPKITLNANTTGVRFSLILLDDNFTAYRATLRNADDREIWTQDKAPSTATPDGKAVVLTVPSANLSSGDYSFLLMGLPTSGSPENIGRYYFHTNR